VISRWNYPGEWRHIPRPELQQRTRNKSLELRSMTCDRAQDRANKSVVSVRATNEKGLIAPVEHPYALDRTHACVRAYTGPLC
jgi:hypothetical protein